MSETEKQPETIPAPAVASVDSPETVGIESATSPIASGNDPSAANDQAVGVTPVASLESEIAALTAQNSELAEQKDAFQNQYIRIAADFDNFRKRTLKEKEDLELRIKCATIGDLLTVVDNFERARTQIKPQNDGEMEIHKSYQGVYKQLVDALKKSGVSPMRPEGQPFDPNLHEAVLRQPTEDFPEGTVIEELQRGYFMGDKILRHALVKVAMPIEQLTAEDAGIPIEVPES
jgi:molecular chaperone GrpE